MDSKLLAGEMTTWSLEAEIIVCCNCGIPFAVPKSYKSTLRKTHEWFYCPNGHQQHYSQETEAEKLARQLRQKENELAQKITANIQLESQLTKIKKSVGQGKCPCCGKTYKHLQNHIKNKHPKGI